MPKPLRDLVLIEKVRREKTPGGIYIPQTFDHKSRPSLKHEAVPDYYEAKVIAVGPEVRDLAPGDTVLVFTYADGDGSKLYTGDGEDGDQLYVRLDDILCAIDPEAA